MRLLSLTLFNKGHLQPLTARFSSCQRRCQTWQSLYHWKAFCFLLSCQAAAQWSGGEALERGKVRVALERA